MPGSDLWIHKSEIFLDERDAKCEGSDECECEYGCELLIANCDPDQIPRYFPKKSKSQEFPRLFENALKLQDISGNGQKMPDCKKMLEDAEVPRIFGKHPRNFLKSPEDVLYCKK